MTALHARPSRTRAARCACAAALASAALLLSACSSPDGSSAKATPSAASASSGARTSLLAQTPDSLNVPRGGRLAVPVTFGWKGERPAAGAELRMTAKNGFTWAAVASRGTRVNPSTVSITYDDLPKSGKTKARLQAPDGAWDASKPALSVELVEKGAAGGSASGDSVSATRAAEEEADVDLFMFPPPRASKPDADGVVTYDFDYGNQGSQPAKGTIRLEPFPGYAVHWKPKECATPAKDGTVTCDLGDIPAQATFTFKVKVPEGATGIPEAVRYSIRPAGSTDADPLNNDGIRFVEINR
ncbi:hypothetical protein ACFYXM_21545 [Streptomyces sp. NPDC002476]|uniref:hypothetical protein n=1 Tax=Streptomyces sp. NPDC002476 TaxID=3364648 RepID=UPI00369FAC90